MKNKSQYNNDPAYKLLVDTAVELHAGNNISDPFSGGRMKLHIMQGYEDAVEVIKAETRRMKHA